MAVSFEAFFWAIATQESGGNYKAVGPQTKYGHAYGKYQVLAPNVAPWTKKYYGKALTAQQFLNNPQAQEAVARGQLQSYYSKYGPQGAAAMWYSGQPDPSKTYGNPPVYKYVSSVMGHAGGYSGQSTPYSGGGSGGGTVPAVPKLDEDELMEQYGLSAALINSSKELKKLFNQAVSGGWSAAKFQASLKNSKWWKSQSSTLRKYITTRATDPATFKQNWGAAQYKVNALAVTVGLGNQISKGKSSKLLKAAIYNSLALGWSDARIKDWLGTKATTHGGIMWGRPARPSTRCTSLPTSTACATRRTGTRKTPSRSPRGRPRWRPLRRRSVRVRLRGSLPSARRSLPGRTRWTWRPPTSSRWRRSWSCRRLTWISSTSTSMAP